MHLFSHHCSLKYSQRGCGPCGAAGFVAGTRVRAAHGWHAVETVDRTTQLCTWPNGTACPADVASDRIWIDPVDCPHAVRPLRVPPGALGNKGEFLLQQCMRVVFNDREVGRAFGADAVTVRAGGLVDFRGIAEVAPPRRKRLVKISFERPAVLDIAGGALVLCDPPLRDLNALLTENPEFAHTGGMTLYHLNASQADAYLASLECAGRAVA